MSTHTLNLEASQQALLDTEFITKTDRGIAEARMIQIGLCFLCLFTMGFMGFFALKTYYLINGFVERHAGAIVTVMAIIQGKKYIYNYCGPRRFVRFVNRQVIGNR